MCVRLVLLACGTAFDIFAYKLRETRPPKFSSHELAGFEITRMTGGFMVVAACEDGATEGILWGNIDTTFVGQDVVIKLPVQEVRPEGSRDVFQGSLQVLEDKRVGLGRVANALV